MQPTSRKTIVAPCTTTFKLLAEVLQVLLSNLRFCCMHQVHYLYRLTNPLGCRGHFYLRGKHKKLILVHLGGCFHG